jgi:asparagine N-glycosylation enzyme membrane subunit Stt3
VLLLNRQEKIIVNNNIFLVDGFDPLTNTVYEYYGSYWHGNPEKYSPNDVNPRIGKTFGELYQHTINRENQIKQFYNLITLWG